MKTHYNAAIIGSGNIGTDLMIKMNRKSGPVRALYMVGIDPESDGLKRASKAGLIAIDSGVDGFIAHDQFNDVDVVFDATSAGAHKVNAQKIHAINPEIQIIDLTPAAIGPLCIPVVNLHENLESKNVNMVTCGGQATIPIVSAISQITPVHYAEIVASISSRSAGPGTRANIDEFTETTAEAIRSVGGAASSKALIVLNPAKPPVIMRDTVFTLTDIVDQALIEASVEAMVAKVNSYVPGYRLKQKVQFDLINDPVTVPGYGTFTGLKTTVMLEVEGAADYLPAFAGNLDIMTSAALHTAEVIVNRSTVNS